MAGNPQPANAYPNRVGFKRTYAAGSFDLAAVQALFADIKATLVAAGFQGILNTATAIDVLRMAVPAGTRDDDLPHWAFVVNDLSPDGGITAHAVFATDYLDAAGYRSTAEIVNSAWLGKSATELRLWFACDGVAGWWWIVGLATNVASPSGYDLPIAAAGTTSRRYASDGCKGLCARYGLWDAWGSWMPAYAMDPTGAPVSGPGTGTWSPFGEGGANTGQRHPGSTLPRMAVPQFPRRDHGITACVLGEFNEILILTDGYALEEAPIPGWIAFVGNVDDQPFALPAPASFATGPA